MLLNAHYAPDTVSGTPQFARCERLFSRYPLAVTGRASDGSRSMVLTDWDARPRAFHILTCARDDLFVIRPWGPRQEASHEIRPGEPVPDNVDQVIAHGMPVPRDGALLGWVTSHQVTAILTVYSRPAADRHTAVLVPEIEVMPLSGSSCTLDWPPFTACPLADGRLWDYVDWGCIVDIAPLLAKSAGHAFWVPRLHGGSPTRSAGRVVVTGSLRTEGYWLPPGVYMDHWVVREGIPAPPVSQLLAQPGIVDLAGKQQVAPRAAIEVPGAPAPPTPAGLSPGMYATGPARTRTVHSDAAG